SAKKKTYAADEYMIQAGEYKRNIYLIRKGLIRVFQISEKGEEITTNLRWENQIIADINCILFNEGSAAYFQALEETEVLYLDYDLLQKIISENPKLEANRKYLFQKILKRALDRIETFVLLNPEERYLNFVKSNPDIVNRVHNKYIAHTLGITPVSLSRIRARIASRKK
ncbi:MAG: Crp/Fnr family transcriptional regulator, partial [Bacteroidota bacterium]